MQDSADLSLEGCIFSNNVASTGGAMDSDVSDDMPVHDSAASVLYFNLTPWAQSRQ